LRLNSIRSSKRYARYVTDLFMMSGSAGILLPSNGTGERRSRGPKAGHRFRFLHLLSLNDHSNLYGTL
jgi:hypothetical protein